MSSRTLTRRREADELIGLSFGPHRAIAPIAVGGFACVVLASGTGIGGVQRTVALKVLRRHLAEDPEFVAMFLDEARLSSLVRHPNIVPVLEFGEGSDGRHYLAMEYVVGEPLSAVIPALSETQRSVLDRAPLVARIIADAAAGLHAAHEALAPDGTPLHLVHRDVAPSNLFVRYDGTTQVIDFGIAKAATRTTRTATGILKGHFAYMAPEQLRSGTGVVDRRADVWALGVVLWEALAGQRLFLREEDGATLMAVIQAPIPSPFAGERTDRELEAIVRGCLERDPERRTPTARAVEEALEEWLAGQVPLVTRHSVGDWMRSRFAADLERHRQLLGRAGLVEDEAHRSQTRRRDPTDPHHLLPLAPTPRPKRRIAIASLAAGALLGALALSGVLGAALVLRPAAAPPTAPAPRMHVTPAPVPSPPPRAPEAAPELAPEVAPLPPPSVPLEPAREVARETPRREPSSAARGSGTGFVNVAVGNGFGRVYLGSRLLGETPGRFELPAGMHRLRIELEGAGARVMRVRIRNGQTTRLLIR